MGRGGGRMIGLTLAVGFVAHLVALGVVAARHNRRYDARRMATH